MQRTPSHGRITWFKWGACLTVALLASYFGTYHLLWWTDQGRALRYSLMSGGSASWRSCAHRLMEKAYFPAQQLEQACYLPGYRTQFSGIWEQQGWRHSSPRIHIDAHFTMQAYDWRWDNPPKGPMKPAEVFADRDALMLWYESSDGKTQILLQWLKGRDDLELRIAGPGRDRGIDEVFKRIRSIQSGVPSPSHP